LKTKAPLHRLTDFSKIMNRAFNSFPALVFILSLFSAGFASAQSSDISPYSRYGIGDLQDQSSVLNSSMGGTGIAYHNDASTPFLINLKNPASYAYGFIPIEDSAGTGGFKMSAFEAGIVDNILSLTTQGQTAKSNNAFLSYIALNIPVNRHFGIGMGILPVSTEGYNITTNGTVQPADTTSVLNQYQGLGGINKVFVGLAYAPCKNFSIGANVSYLFGNLTNEEDVYFYPNSAALSTLKIENTSIHSFDADFGLMYNVNLKKYKDHPEKNWYLTIGATIAPSFTMYAGYSLFSSSQFSTGGGNYTIDTLQNINTNGEIRIPLMYGVGITLKKGDHLTISADRSGQNWSQYSYFGQQENLTDSYQWGVGVQYVPNKDFPKNYFQRLQYRIGASYGQSNLDLYNTPLVNEYISFGVGVPIGLLNPIGHPAMVNLGIQVGKLGTTTNNLIQQNYIKLLASFTFDDHWFDKRKFQ
jgi:hypothetical protein